jgi:hypothetical protein
VTISTTDSQPSSIQFIDEVKLDFNMQVLDDLEKEGEKDDMMIKIPQNDDDFKPKIIEAEIKVTSEFDDKMKVNGNGTNESITDLEINNNISKTAIIHGESQDIMMNKFLSEIVFKGGDDSAIDDMTTSEDNATLTSSTMSESSSESSSSTNVVTTSSIKKNNVPQSTANFIKNERRQIEKNFNLQNQDIKFTTSYENHNNNNSHQPREPQKRMSQIEQIRQNFEKSSQGATEIPAPIPVARKSSIPLSTQNKNGSPKNSKIPVFKTNSSSSSKISPKSRTNSVSRLNSNTDS